MGRGRGRRNLVIKEIVSMKHDFHLFIKFKNIKEKNIKYKIK